MSNQQTPAPGGCQVIIAFVAVSILCIYIWSNISSCVTPKRPPSPAAVARQEADMADYKAGKAAGEAFARENYSQGASYRKTSGALELTAKAQRNNGDFIRGFSRGYNQEWSRLSK